MKIKKIWPVVVFGGVAFGQINNPSGAKTFAGVPSGACTSAQMAVDTTTGRFYDCLSGAWTLVGPLATHNLLSATHADTLAHAVVLGDLVFGNSTPLWAALAGNTTATKKFLAQTGNGSVSAAPGWNVIVGGDLPSPAVASLGGVDSKDCTGTGHVLSINTDGSVTCSADAAAGGGASTSDSFITISHDADLTGERTLAGTTGDVTVTDGGANNSVTLDTGANIPKVTTSNAYSAGTTQTLDTALVKYYNDAPIFNASRYAGADPCAKIAAVYADAAYTAATKAIIDATGFTGDQACGTNALAVTRNTWIQLGAVTLHATVQQTFGWPSSTRLATPAATVLASSTTTGGTLSGAVFVKVTLAGPFPGIVGGVNITETLASAETSFAMNAACTGTPTCTATVTAPTAQLGSPGYYVYEANTTGAEKLCNIAPMPFGTNYVIKANCAGTVPSGANLADVDMNVLSGIGQSTRWSMDCAGCNLNVNAWDWWLRDFEVVGTRTDYNTTAMLVVFSNTIIDRLTFVGGHTHIAASGVANLTIRGTTHSGHTLVGHGILVQGNSDVWIDGVTLLPGVLPTGAATYAGVYIQNTTRFRVTNFNARNLDFSQTTNAAGIFIDNSSYGLLGNINCDGLTNADCWAITNISHNITVLGTTCRNANVLAPIGTFGNNGDCGDVFSSGQIKITDFDADSGSIIAGFRPPLLEIYNSQDVTVTSANIHNGSGEGISTFGTPGARFVAIDAALNFNSGMLVQDFSGTVSCNNTTTVTRLSGQSFGPWNIGTAVTINGNPFTIAAIPTSTNSLTVNTNCATVASTTMTLSTNDMLIANSNFDTNGRNTTHVATTSEGLVFSGGNRAQIVNVSANDNQTTKHQTFGLRLNNTARVTCAGCNFNSNLTGSYIDNVGTSSIDLDDGATSAHVITALDKLGQTCIVADSAAINTTETIIAKTAAFSPNRLVAGSTVRFTLIGTNTPTVANASTFTLRWGTNGTTADGSVAALVTSVSGTTGTNVAFRTVIDWTVRTTGASATNDATLQLISDANTGIVVTPNVKFLAGSTFSTATTSGILSVSYKSAASTTTSTFRQACIEVLYH